MSESKNIAEAVEEETVQLVFYVGESDEVDFTTDIPKYQFDLLVVKAEEKGISLEELLIEIITSDMGLRSAPAEAVPEDK